MNYDINRWSDYKKAPHEGHDVFHRETQKAAKPLITIDDIFPKWDRWSIGYTSTFDNLQHLAKAAKTASYPPYDVVNYDDETSLVSIAVAGFSKDDITISVTDGVLQVNGAKAVVEEDDNGPKVTSEHKGIASRPFHLTFAIAEYYEVVGAGMENGMLNISLRKNLPEEKKPKVIEIN